MFALPVSAFGVALIGGLGAMIAFGIGLLLRAYSMPLLGGDIAKLYIPHGMMIGAGLVALVQVALLVMKHNGKAATGKTPVCLHPMADAGVRAAAALALTTPPGGAVAAELAGAGTASLVPNGLGIGCSRSPPWAD